MAVSKSQHRIWEFGPFRLDEAERLLLREGRAVGLTPKVFDTLVALIEQSGHLVEKEALIERLWPDTFVEEGALTRNISDLRKALGAGTYIETVPKRGYRFAAPVSVIGVGQATLIIEKTTEAHLVIEEKEAETQGDDAGLDSPHFVASLPEDAAEAATPAPAARLPGRRASYSLKPWLLVWLGAGLLIAGGALGLHELFKSATSAEQPRRSLQATQVSRFTASGNILSAAISPDGKTVATVLDEGGFQSLWVRQVAANTSGVRLTQPALVDYWGLTFSNDSNFIYYVLWVRNQSDAGLYQIPVLGGTPRPLPVVVDTPVSFSPAGDRFAYVYSSSSRGESYVKMAEVAGGDIETVVKRQNPGFFTAWPGGPAWSPDGRWIAYAATDPVAEEHQRVRVFVAGVDDKQERQLTKQSWHTIGRVVWLGDGSGLVISAREQMDAPRQLWLVSYPDGAARKLTNDLHDYDSVSLTADAKTLAAVQTQEAFSISVAPYGDGMRASADLLDAREIFFEVGSGRERLAWTPDHRIVYCSRAGDNWDIWLMNQDGSGQRQLTVDPHNDLFPSVSSDGRFIFFVSDRAGAFNIWRMEIDGSHPAQLTRGGNQTLPEVTPDGQWVVYQQGVGPDEISLWRVAAAGGAPEHLADRLAQRPAASPDGRQLAYVQLDEKGWGMAIFSFERGEVTKTFPFPPTVGARFFRWTPDGAALAYIANEKGAANIWLQPLSGLPPKRLTNFKAGQLLSFAWSPDGGWLAYMRHTATSDVVLLRDFK